MDRALIWSLIPGIVAVLFALSLLYLSRRHQWTEIETPLEVLNIHEETEKQANDLKSKLSTFISKFTPKGILNRITIITC